MSDRVESLESLSKSILENTDTTVDEKKELLREIRRFGHPIDDKWLYRCVVWILGIVAIFALVSSTWILIDNNDKTVTVPNGIVALGSTAIGALAGWLVPHRKQENKS